MTPEWRRGFCPCVPERLPDVLSNAWSTIPNKAAWTVRCIVSGRRFHFRRWRRRRRRPTKSRIQSRYLCPCRSCRSRATPYFLSSRRPCPLKSNFPYSLRMVMLSLYATVGEYRQPRADWFFDKWTQRAVSIKRQYGRKQPSPLTPVHVRIVRRQRDAYVYFERDGNVWSLRMPRSKREAPRCLQLRIYLRIPVFCRKCQNYFFIPFYFNIIIDNSTWKSAGNESLWFFQTPTLFSRPILTPFRQIFFNTTLVVRPHRMFLYNFANIFF